MSSLKARSHAVETTTHTQRLRRPPRLLASTSRTALPSVAIRTPIATTTSRDSNLMALTVLITTFHSWTTAMCTLAVRHSTQIRVAGCGVSEGKTDRRTLGAPGPDRVIINRRCELAGQITHTGSRQRNGFVDCENPMWVPDSPDLEASLADEHIAPSEPRGTTTAAAAAALLPLPPAPARAAPVQAPTPTTTIVLAMPLRRLVFS